MHEPDMLAEGADPLLSARQRRSRDIRRAAKAAFPGGVEIGQDPDAVEAALEATQRAIEDGAQRLYGAVFRHDGVCVAVDILEREGSGWVVKMVASTTSVREDHLDNATLQAWVVHSAGLDIDHVDVVHLDRACVHPDLSNLFAVVDVSDHVRERLPRVGRKLEAASHTLAGPLPDAHHGVHCDRPTACPFLERCRPARPIDHVSRLYYGGRRVRELLHRGVARIADIPPEIELRGVQDRQRRAILAGGLVVDEGLADLLDGFADASAGTLAFGTLAPPIPLWDGCRPYDEVPVQFAVRVALEDGQRVTSSFIPEGAADPRPALARALVGELEGAEVIWVWNVALAQRHVEGLMDAVPEEAEALEVIWDRLEDLLPLVRDHVYHPAFAGGFELETVLPVLIPDLASDEGAAGADALDLVCRRDVEGLAALHAWLRAHA